MASSASTEPKQAANQVALSTVDTKNEHGVEKGVHVIPSQEGVTEVLKGPRFDLKDADEAAKAYAQYDGEDLVLTPEIEKALLRKIDRNIMPMMCIVYMFNSLDKTTLSYASVMGLKQSIKLVGDNYSWLGS